MTSARVVLVGEADDADVRAADVVLDAGGRASFTLQTPQGTRAVHLGLVGRHHVGNALAVVAVATELGMPLESVCAALESARPVSRWRMEVVERADGVTLVNDAYNANPDSMRAALTALERMGEGRRTWAVLGTMLELGDESEALHAEVGAEVVARGVDELVVVGPAAAALAAGARGRAARHPGPVAEPTCARSPTPTRPRRCSPRELAAGDVVLFKSSRDAGLRLLGDRLAGTREEADVKAVLIAAVVSLVIALFGTPMFIRFLVRKGYGQFIRDDGPTSHHTKRGTPTMGGAVIVGSSLAAYAVAHLVTGQAAHGQRRARPVPDDRAGPDRLPRRLHQDQQAAQPGPAHRREAGRADPGRGDLRDPRAAVPQQLVPHARRRRRSRSSATRRSTWPSPARSAGSCSSSSGPTSSSPARPTA